MGRVSSPPPGRASPSVAGRDPRRPWAPSPFTRLARTHAGSVSGDALFAIGLAGSVFFDVNFSAARWRVALYLVLTIAPFAVAAPIIGPAIDRIRGGRRWIIVGVAGPALRAGRAHRAPHEQRCCSTPRPSACSCCRRCTRSPRARWCPGTVRSDEELVEANSKLTVLSAVAVVVAAAPGGLLLAVGGGGWSVAAAAVVYARRHRLRPAAAAHHGGRHPAGPGREGGAAQRRASCLAASAMGLMRGIVGFLAFMLAFDFKSTGAPLWELGVVAATAQVGFFVGAVLAPRLRKAASPRSTSSTATLVGTTVGGLVDGRDRRAARGRAALDARGQHRPARPSSPSTPSSSATRPTPTGAAPSPGSRPASSWCGSSARSSRSSSPSRLRWASPSSRLAAGVTAAWYSVGQRGIRQGRVPQRRSPRLASRLAARARGAVADGSASDWAAGDDRPPPPPPGDQRHLARASPAVRRRPRRRTGPSTGRRRRPALRVDRVLSDRPRGPRRRRAPDRRRPRRPTHRRGGRRQRRPPRPTLFDGPGPDAPADPAPSAPGPAPTAPADPARRWMPAGDAPTSPGRPRPPASTRPRSLPGGDPTTVAPAPRRATRACCSAPRTGTTRCPRTRSPRSSAERRAQSAYSMRASQRPGRVDLGGGRQGALGLPEAAQALVAGPLDHAVDERRAPVVGGLGELEAEEALDEAVGRGGLDPASPQGLGDHAVAGQQLAADLVHDVVDVADDGADERLEAGEQLPLGGGLDGAEEDLAGRRRATGARWPTVGRTGRRSPRRCSRSDGVGLEAGDVALEVARRGGPARAGRRARCGTRPPGGRPRAAGRRRGGSTPARTRRGWRG